MTGCAIPAHNHSYASASLHGGLNGLMPRLCEAGAFFAGVGRFELEGALMAIWKRTRSTQTRTIPKFAVPGTRCGSEIVLLSAEKPRGEVTLPCPRCGRRLTYQPSDFHVVEEQLPQNPAELPNVS